MQLQNPRHFHNFQNPHHFHHIPNFYTHLCPFLCPFLCCQNQAHSPHHFHHIPNFYTHLCPFLFPFPFLCCQNQAPMANHHCSRSPPKPRPSMKPSNALRRWLLDRKDLKRADPPISFLWIQVASTPTFATPLLLLLARLIQQTPSRPFH